MRLFGFAFGVLAAMGAQQGQPAAGPANAGLSNRAGSDSATYAPHLSFDVVSIHESRDGHFSYIDNPLHASFYMSEGVSVAGLIRGFYGIKAFGQLGKVPDWVGATRYTISAKSDAATDAELARLSDADARAEKEHMVRAMLADRFGLRIHGESRTSTTYELDVTDRTSKLMTATKGPIGDCSGHFSEKGIEVGSPKGCPFGAVTMYVQSEFDTPIVDRTGMTGSYAFRLMFMPKGLMKASDEEEYPDLAHALKEQLGLELKPIRAPVTYWTVDHIERPTPN